MGAYVVLAHNRRLPLQQVVALIILNLVIGFADPAIGWQAHIGGLAVGALLAFLYDRADQLRPRAQSIAATVAASAGTLAVLTALVLLIAPGHVNVGS
jgi:membrane associated rhomboid family serine protease